MWIALDVDRINDGQRLVSLLELLGDRDSCLLIGKFCRC